MFAHRKPTCLSILGFLAATIACVACDAQAQQKVSPAKLKAITRMLQQEVDAKRIPGAVAVISHHGKVVYSESVGYHDAEFAQEIKSDAIFRIASMTKAITSVGVMQLVERGKLSLNDPLSKYLPAFADEHVLNSIEGDDVSTMKAERPVTIHDLLTHRSGLTYGWFGPEKLDAIYQENNILNGPRSRMNF